MIKVASSGFLHRGFSLLLCFQAASFADNLMAYGQSSRPLKALEYCEREQERQALLTSRTENIFCILVQRQASAVPFTSPRPKHETCLKHACGIMRRQPLYRQEAWASVAQRAVGLIMFRGHPPCSAGRVKQEIAT